MADETKFTIKVGAIIGLVSSLIIFIMTCLWNHQTKITVLEADYKHVYKKLDTIENLVFEIHQNQIKQNIGDRKKSTTHD